MALRLATLSLALLLWANLFIFGASKESLRRKLPRRDPGSGCEDKQVCMAAFENCAAESPSAECLCASTAKTCYDAATNACSGKLQDEAMSFYDDVNGVIADTCPVGCDARVACKTTYDACTDGSCACASAALSCWTNTSEGSGAVCEELDDMSGDLMDATSDDECLGCADKVACGDAFHACGKSGEWTWDSECACANTAKTCLAAATAPCSGWLADDMADLAEEVDAARVESCPAGCDGRLACLAAFEACTDGFCPCSAAANTCLLSATAEGTGGVCADIGDWAHEIFDTAAEPCVDPATCAPKNAPCPTTGGACCKGCNTKKNTCK
jgi:hypothetical protein